MILDSLFFEIVCLEIDEEEEFVLNDRSAESETYGLVDLERALAKILSGNLVTAEILIVVVCISCSLEAVGYHLVGSWLLVGWLLVGCWLAVGYHLVAQWVVLLVFQTVSEGL